jgi:hypothetical protein
VDRGRTQNFIGCGHRPPHFHQSQGLQLHQPNKLRSPSAPNSSAHLCLRRPARIGNRKSYVFCFRRQEVAGNSS